MKDLIINGSRQLDIPLDDVQVDKLMEYARLFVEWNEKINLTAITDDDGFETNYFLVYHKSKFLTRSMQSFREYIDTEYSCSFQ